MNSIAESLGVLRQKISRNNAYLGVLIGTAVFTFALFLSWVSIRAGQLASDGGAFSGWQENAYLAILPLAYALYPIFRKQPVHLKNLLICIGLSFGLLIFNNVVFRSTWRTSAQRIWGGEMGSSLDTGFWLGLLAMVAISACGIAWSLHSTDNDQKPEGQNWTN
jgi:hypothetical protein